MNIVSIVKSLVPRFLGTSQSYEPNMVFRVMFVSPFFELEVDTGDEWKTVHAQEPELVLEDGTKVYPVLRFPSFPSAVDYATKTLGVTRMKPYSAIFFTSPPASWNAKAEPRIIEPQAILDNKVVPVSQLQPAAQRIEGFTVIKADHSIEVERSLVPSAALV